MKRLLVTMFVCACGGGGSAKSPDAMIDTPPPIPGDFTCVGKAPPTTAQDPSSISGNAMDHALAPIPSAAVEVHAVTGDALLLQMTTGTGSLDRGKYAGPIATGGAPTRIYRKLSLTGYFDAYGYDPDAITGTNPEIGTLMFTAAQLDAVYAAAGMTRDPGKGTLWIDVHDCPSGQPRYLAGATVESSSGSVFYVDDTFTLDPTLTATASVGGALVLNIAPGTADPTIHAGPITYPSWPVEIHAGAFTEVDRHP